MRKIITLLFAALVLLAFRSTATAEQEENAWSFPQTGMEISLNEQLKQAQGILIPEDLGEIDPDRKMAFCAVSYAFGENNQVPLYHFISVGYNLDFEAVRDVLLADLPKDIYIPYELGRAGEYCFYLLQLNAESDPVKNAIALVPENLRNEYTGLLGNTEELIAGISVHEPEKSQNVAVPSENDLPFTVNDLSGNTVTSGELFAGHPVTVINLWATWCGPCVNELPQLEKLWKEYSQRGVGFVGICLDAMDSRTAYEATNLAKKAGITYPMLACNREVERLFDPMLEAYPTTIFVNEKGEIIAQPVVGADPDAYRRTLESLLNR